MCDQYGVLRAQLQLWEFGGRFLLEFCRLWIGGDSCLPSCHVPCREVSSTIVIAHYGQNHFTGSRRSSSFQMECFVLVALLEFVRALFGENLFDQ